MDADITRDPARIVVGVDGSEHSVAALREAARLAAALDRPLAAVIAWEWPALGLEYAPTDWNPEDDARALLDTTIEQAFGAEPPARLARAVVAGHPSRVLVEESRRASMLVVGSRGHGSFAALLLGSVSGACAAHASCPVLVVRDRDESAES